jgi:hypothetical protein
MVGSINGKLMITGIIVQNDAPLSFPIQRTLTLFWPARLSDIAKYMTHIVLAALVTMVRPAITT